MHPFKRDLKETVWNRIEQTVIKSVQALAHKERCTWVLETCVPASSSCFKSWVWSVLSGVNGFSPLCGNECNPTTFRDRAVNEFLTSEKHASPTVYSFISYFSIFRCFEQIDTIDHNRRSVV